MRGRSRRRRAATLTALTLLVAAVAGCGFQVSSPDLFLLTRTGPGGKLTLLVNDGGTIRCDGGPARKLSDPTLIQARDLAENLGKLASRHLRLPRTDSTVDYFTVRLQQGTVAFPDAAAAHRRTLAQAELFATEQADRHCPRTG
jgi:hypothetical protein